MKKVLIRADGGMAIGLGHIMRMLTLSKELKKYCEVIFICKNNKKYLAGVHKILENGFKVEVIDENNLIDEIKKVQYKINGECLITDSYDVDEEYFHEVSKIFKKIVYIDDYNIGRINADMLINYNIYAEDIDYDTSLNKKCKKLLGTNYIILRKEFVKKVNKKINSKVENIMVTVGGMDDQKLTMKIIELFKDSNCKLHIIIGGAFKEDLIKDIYKFNIMKVKPEIYVNASMSEVMLKCDMAIAGCGSTLYELSALGIPTIGIVIAENQQKIANTFHEKGIIINTNKMIFEDKDRFLDIVEEIMSNRKKRMEMSKAGMRVVNGNGSSNVANKIFELIN